MVTRQLKGLLEITDHEFKNKNKNKKTVNLAVHFPSVTFSCADVGTEQVTNKL